MWSKRTEETLFDQLCTAHYEKILRYLFYKLQDEQAARDTVQEVFLIAWRRRMELAAHPNPGGFLFQTAKNLAHKVQREAFARLKNETEPQEQLSVKDGVEQMLDRQIDENAFVEELLNQLSPEKRSLYNLYYLRGETMKAVANQFGLEEAAVRMRYVRLRREIQSIVARLAEKKFSV